MRKPAAIAMLAGAAAIYAASDVTACQTPVMPGSRKHGQACNDHHGHVTPQGRSCG